MTPDPALETVREARRQISRELGHDAARVIERYKRMQAEFRGHIILGPEAPAQQGVEPDGTTPSPSVGRRAAG
jgi:hypothetical protein